MSAVPWDPDDRRRRALRTTVAVSAMAHAVLVGVLLSIPSLRRDSIRLPGVITVELVAAAPAPAARAKPAPRPAPAARPAPPAPKKVVLPTRPTRRAVPKPAPLVAKPEPKPKATEEDYEDLLAKLRADAGEDAPEPVEVVRRTTPRPPPAPAPATPRPAPQAVPGAQASGPGIPAPPEVVAWLRDARIHVRREWVLAAGFRLQALETHVSVELDSGGRVLGDPDITRRSGNPWYDESVVRAIQKASPLPAPPEAGKWPFIFRPEDY